MKPKSPEEMREEKWKKAIDGQPLRSVLIAGIEMFTQGTGFMLNKVKFSAQELLDFLEYVIASRDAELVKWVEGKKQELDSNPYTKARSVGYNTALEDIKAHLLGKD